jgi:site-specific DNA-methyltransferase (adenine-specific)
MIEINRIYNEDCLLGMQRIEDGSIDCILTDPPYLYLKNQKLDRPFDETAFFNQAKRVLKKDGFIVLFGRGTSFYRWNTMLAGLGFAFKEEIIWNKRRNSIPAAKLLRIHENISVYTKGNGKIIESKINYEECKEYDMDSIISDVNRIKSALGTTELNDLIRFLKEKKLRYTYKHQDKIFFKNSFGERSRAAATMNSIVNGMKEKSIIECLANHYSAIHPTQKPVRLSERLLALVGKEGDLVLDPFSGSASTAIAALNTGRNFIGFEIDKEYYNAASAPTKLGSFTCLYRLPTKHRRARCDEAISFSGRITLSRVKGSSVITGRVSPEIVNASLIALLYFWSDM